MADNDCAELKRVAESYGVTMLLGCRGDGTWFAHALMDDPIEYDGGKPSDAIEGVRAALRERTARQYNKAGAHAILIERFRAALMRAHSDEWDMATVSDAAHVCAAEVIDFVEPHKVLWKQWGEGGDARGEAE